jgi:hypothetical protein
VRSIACEEGLAEFADRLVDSVVPGWRLDDREDAVLAASGASKIGGDPDLAVGESWPINHRGIPMTFLAQINTDELPELAEEWAAVTPRPAAGVLLRVFANLVDDPVEPGPARVLATALADELMRTAAPGIPSPWPTGGQWDNVDLSERVSELPEASVKLTGFLTAPETHPILSPDGGFSSGPMGDRYYAWANRLRLDGRDYNAGSSEGRMPWEVHHFLGEASSVQADVRGYAAAMFATASVAAFLGYEPDARLAHDDAWQTLLSLHNDDNLGLDILDGGVYTVLVPTVDLREGTFHRTVCAIDSS